MELLIKINIYEIIIVSIVVSFAVEGFSAIFRKAQKRWTLPIFAFLITVLRIFPLETLNFEQPSAMAFNFILTGSFAVLFYKYGGERIVKVVTGSITDRITNTTKARENEPFN